MPSKRECRVGCCSEFVGGPQRPDRAVGVVASVATSPDFPEWPPACRRDRGPNRDFYTISPAGCSRNLPPTARATGQSGLRTAAVLCTARATCWPGGRDKCQSAEVTRQNNCQSRGLRKARSNGPYARSPATPNRIWQSIWIGRKILTCGAPSSLPLAYWRALLSGNGLRAQGTAFAAHSAGIRAYRHRRYHDCQRWGAARKCRCAFRGWEHRHRRRRQRRQPHGSRMGLHPLQWHLEPAAEADYHRLHARVWNIGHAFGGRKHCARGQQQPGQRSCAFAR